MIDAPKRMKGLPFNCSQPKKKKKKKDQRRLLSFTPPPHLSRDVSFSDSIMLLSKDQRKFNEDSQHRFEQENQGIEAPPWYEPVEILASKGNKNNSKKKTFGGRKG